MNFKNLKRIALSMSIITTVSFITPQITNVYAMSFDKSEKISKNIEKFTGVDKIIKSTKSDSTYNAIVDNGESIINIPKYTDDTIEINDIKNPNEYLEVKLPTSKNIKGKTTKNGTIVYENENSLFDLAVQPTESGFKGLINIKNSNAPKEYKFYTSLPEGSKLVTAKEYLGKEFDTKEIFVINSENIVTNIISPAWAKDANGKEISTNFKIEGNTLIQVVNFDENDAFPIVADPDWWKVTKCAGAIAWVIGSTVFCAAKLLKIKKYIKALGGVREAAILLTSCTTWEEKMNKGGKALVQLAAELTGVSSLSVCFK